MGIMTLLSDGDTFNPRRLFVGSTVGAIYDYDDFAYLYQKADGSTAVTALEQPMGLMRDKRYGDATGADQRSAGAPALLGSATAATFNTSTGAGSVTLVDASNQSSVRFTLTANTFYRINLVNNGSADLQLRSGTESGTVWSTVAAGATSTRLVLSSTAGVISITAASAATITFTVSALVSLPGLHAYQSTDAARPVISARYNLLVGTATLATQSVTTLAASYTLTFTGTGTVTLSGTATGTKSAGSNVFTATAGTLTLTVSGSVTTADLRLTADANARLPAYQRVTTATDYDSNGFPRYLKFDGTDDQLLTAAADFSGTAAATIFSGVGILSNATYGGIFTLGTTVDDPGAFMVWARSSDGGGQLESYLRGSTSATTGNVTGNSALTVPQVSVISVLFDASQSTIAAEIVQRMNGAVLPSTGASTAGTGNLANAVLTIGNYPATNVRFSGRLYPSVVIGKAPNAGEIAATEQWLRARCPAVF